MRIILIAAAACAVSGCAMSAGGLARSEVDLTLTSSKTPKDWALCSVEAMLGPNELRDDGTNWWILRVNGYHVPITRWDFKPTASGSRAELRTTVGLSNGDDKVRACA